MREALCAESVEIGAETLLEPLPHAVANSIVPNARYEKPPMHILVGIGRLRKIMTSSLKLDVLTEEGDSD